MNVALVHDQFLNAGAAERVVEGLRDMYPEAPIYTTVVRRESLTPGLVPAEFRTGWLQSFASLGLPVWALAPFVPGMLASQDCAAFEVVITTGTAFARGARAKGGACHICYCDAPIPPLRLRHRARSFRFVAATEAVADELRERLGVHAKVVDTQDDAPSLGAFASGRLDEALYRERLRAVIDRTVEEFQRDRVTTALRLMQGGRQKRSDRLFGVGAQWLRRAP